MTLVECLDVGGTRLRYALIEDGTIRFEQSLRTPLGDFPTLWSAIQGLMTEGRAYIDEQVDLTCIGLPGPIHKNILLGSNPLQISDDVDLSPYLKMFRHPVVFDNDLNLAIYAEKKRGAGLNFKNVYVLTLSTGLGTGILWNGEVIDGPVGEFGSCVLDNSPDAPLCVCGRTGCWQAYSSGRGIEMAAERLTGKKMSAEEVFDQAKKDDELREIVEHAHTANAQGIGLMLNVFPVDYIAIMGSVGVNQFKEVIPTANEIAPYTNHTVPPIRLSKLGDSIGIWGAYEKGRILLEKK